MTANEAIHVPFLLDFSNLAFDRAVIFFVAILTAVTVHAEAQALMAAVLGDAPKNPGDRFHFNPIRHLDLSGTVCFAAAGFGWPRPLAVRTERFKRPGLGLVLTRFAGPFANLVLAGIAGSILWIMGAWGVEDQVFSVVLAVNLSVFAASFIPLPLAGASILSPLVPERARNGAGWNLLTRVFPYALVLFIIFSRARGWPLLENTLHPVVSGLYRFMSG